MPGLESGVVRYVHCVAQVDVKFPVDSRGNEYVCCEQCPYYHNMSRCCGLDNNVVPAFPTKFVGHGCPLIRVDN